MNTIARQPQGGTYHFIRFSNLKNCQTTDCRFDSDNEKFENGNYFLSPDTCKACSIALREQFAEPLEAIENKRDQNRQHFIHAVENACLGKFEDDEDEDSKPKKGADDKGKRTRYRLAPLARTAKKAERDPHNKAVSYILDAFKEFSANRDALNKEAAEIRAQVKDITINWPKI